ncbi:hypothetical protein BH09MYX1_BH09MYX1_36660 [soil metagenome]
MPNNLGYIGLGPTGLSFGYVTQANIKWWISWAGATTNGVPPANTSIDAGIAYMFALDMDTKALWIGSNGVWFNGGDPETNLSPVVTGLSGTVYPGVTLYSSSLNAMTANFGQGAFAYTVPKGFIAGIF